LLASAVGTVYSSGSAREEQAWGTIVRTPI
jgi:hypothetical protein